MTQFSGSFLLVCYTIFMKIIVGSHNQTKVDAVKQVFPDAIVESGDAPIEEFGHPKSFEETLQGAKARAEAVFRNCDLSIGLESGLMRADSTSTGYFETTVCSLFDGSQHYVGAGPAFQWPKEVLTQILEGSDGSQAFRAVGLTDHVKLGTENGAIYYLTNERVKRVELNVAAIKMALI